MKMNEKKFFKTEFGAELQQTVTALDMALEERRKVGINDDEKMREIQPRVNELMARLDVYKQGLRTFYGIDLCFTRTDEYYGLCTEDESYYLLKVEKRLK